MKELVKELAISIRDTITMTPPQIVELQSKVILNTMAIKLERNKIISLEQCIEMMDEIDKLYGI